MYCTALHQVMEQQGVDRETLDLAGAARIAPAVLDQVGRMVGEERERNWRKRVVDKKPDIDAYFRAKRPRGEPTAGVVAANEEAAKE